MSKVDVLVADDHDIVRRGLRDLLEKQPGWKVVGEAANGREAVEKAKQLKPDVSILDISMPPTAPVAAVSPRTRPLAG